MQLRAVAPLAQRPVHALHEPREHAPVRELGQRVARVGRLLRVQPVGRIAEQLSEGVSLPCALTLRNLGYKGAET